MGDIQRMPPITVPQTELARFGARWTALSGALSRTPPESSNQLGQLFNDATGSALAHLLGDIPIVKPRNTALLPEAPDCVEVGEVRIVGGVRPQNFDVGYRPDGLRFAADTKTLNDTNSVRKNYQNMINDLATEATTVHIRFPNAIVAFIVVVPKPCLSGRTGEAVIARLEGLAGRDLYTAPSHLAEAIALVVWDPATGEIDAMSPPAGSTIRIERFSEIIEHVYRHRYGGLPPHV